MTPITYSGGPSIDEVRAKTNGNKIYKLSSNENPLGPSPKALTAVQQAAASLNIYPPRDDMALRQALVAYHGRFLTPDHIACADSGFEMLDIIARTWLRPDDEYIICPPTFGAYVRTARLQAATAVSVPLHPHTFAHDIDAILNAITPRTKLIYICNPNNPTGVMMPAADMDRLVQNLPAHVTLIADEVYQHFVESGDFPDTLKHVQNGRSVIIIQSFSKAFGLAGLRLGYCIADPALIEQIAPYKRPFHLNSIAQAAGIAALSDHDHLQKSIANAHQSKRYLAAELDKLGIAHWPTETNFMLIKPTQDAAALNEKLLARGIMVRPTNKNGLPGYLRVSFGLPEGNEAFMAALTEIVGEA